MSTKQHGLVLLITVCFNQMLLVSPTLYAQNSSLQNTKVIEVTLPSDSMDKSKKITMIPYDEEIYNLAYKVYLLNTHINDAYAVAVSAVQQTERKKLWQQNDIWRLRLAQVAVWQHEPEVAAKQYLYLSRKSEDSDALIKGMAIAKSASDDTMMLKFLSIAFNTYHKKQDIIKQMLGSLLRLGEPDKALSLLNQNKGQESHVFYLLTSANIFELVSNLKAQLNVLTEYSTLYGSSPQVSLKKAIIYVANNQINLAAKVLFLAKQKAMITNQGSAEFWDAYSILASLIHTNQEEAFAYKQLIKTHHASEKVYINLVDLTGEVNPNLAYEYAKQGKNAYPTNLTLAIDAFSLALRNSSWQDFPKLDASIPQAIRRMLKFDSAYGEVKANYLQSIRMHDAAVQRYMQLVNDIPGNAYIKSDFLFFLIQTNDINRLATALSCWRSEHIFSELLWGSYAEGFYSLNNLSMALASLQLFYDQFKKYQHDPYWLINFKDILESTYYIEESWAVTHYAWPLYVKLLALQKEPLDYTQLLNYVKLSMQEAPGDTTGEALTFLQKFVNSDTELLLLTWAFNTNNDALADAVYYYYKLIGIVPPAWAVLSIALRHEDLYLMRDVIANVSSIESSTPSKVSSYRDKVQAAQEIDDTARAQQYAYEALQQHPYDSNLYDNYFTPMMLKTANKLSTSQEFYQYANAEGPKNVSSFTYFYSPSISITPYHSIWFSNELAPQATPINQSVAISSQVIVNIPKHDEREGVRIGIVQHRGDLLLDVGHRSDLNGFETVRLQRQYQVFQDLNTVFDLGYHQQADDSLGLLVGGMKNDVHISANYRLSSQNALLGDYFQNFFYTQSGQHVANGMYGTLNVEHRFNLTYPDWTLAIYGTGASYFDKTKALTGKILTLVPPGVPANAGFLIPSNFTEYGITGSFGQSLVDDYTHAWRPFGSLTFSRNSNVGFGTLYNIGISGCVFGRDKLLLYYSRGKNQGTGIQLQQVAKISYSLYF